MQKAKGETRPSRAVVTLYGDHASRPDPDMIHPPQGMTEGAQAVWRDKIERYRQRGQKVGGFEDALRQYCELEAALLASWKDGTTTMAMVTAHRMWCAEFYDTPASQRVPAGNGKGASENPFARNGQKPSA